MVKKYVMDESKSWEERYKELEAHHIAETTELKAKLDCVRAKADEIQKQLESFAKQLKAHQDKIEKILGSSRS